jgi:hypothetical protein
MQNHRSWHRADQAECNGIVGQTLCFRLLADDLEFA